MCDIHSMQLYAIHHHTQNTWRPYNFSTMAGVEILISIQRTPCFVMADHLSHEVEGLLCST